MRRLLRNIAEGKELEASYGDPSVVEQLRHNAKRVQNNLFRPVNPKRVAD